MNRRHFIKSIASFVGVFLLNPRSATGAEMRLSCSADLRTVIGDFRSAKKSGRAYLARYPEDDNFEFLYGEVFEQRITCDQLNAMKEKDFQGERLVTLDGWYVTQTEARLLALAALV